MKNRIIITLILSALFILEMDWVYGVSANSAIVIEQSSGRVLYEKRAEDRLPMASTTKIMTAIVAIENGNLEDSITISSLASNTEGSSMYLQEGEKMSLRELLYGLMLSSGNDAAVAISEYFGGVEKFVEMMNKKADEIGADNTNFTNPNGLPDDNHYSTALDMARITAYSLSNPTFSEIVATKTYKVTGEGKAYPRVLSNHNKLLSSCEGCIGVKTGYTKVAGRCLVSGCKREGMTLICVTLNAPDDWSDHRELYDDLFSKYKMRAIVKQGETFDRVNIAESETTSLDVKAERDFYYPLRTEENCLIDFEISEVMEAPVKTGEKCGEIQVVFNDAEVKRINLVTDGNADKINPFKKWGNSLKETIGAIYWSWVTFLQN